MGEKEEFTVGPYSSVCNTDYRSPAFARATCNLTKGGDFRAEFRFEVDKGDVKLAEAEMHRKVFDELKAEAGSVNEVKDIISFMDARNKDRVTLTILEDSAKEKELWADVAKMF